MAKREGILFISHTATRTGAPLVLLHFLRWFKQNVAIPFEVLFNEGGELEKEFAELAPTSSLDRIFGTRRTRLLQIERRNLPGLARVTDAGRLRWKLRGLTPSLVYVNSAANAEILRALPAFAAPVITHVHEMEYALRWTVGPVAFDYVKGRTTHWVAASRAAADNLIANHGILPAAVDVAQMLPALSLGGGDATSAKARLIRRLNLPAEAMVVGGSGVMGWGKGTDLFVQLAAEICRSHPSLPVHFVWVGWGDQTAYGGQMMHDARHAGIEDRIHMTGQVENPREFYAGLDVFVFPSRDDSFGLVCAEAAALGVPIVCFASGGGMPDFVEEDCGIVVPYLDVPAMASAVVDLLGDRQRRLAMGAAGRAKVVSRLDVSVAAPRLAEIIQRVQSAAGRS